MSPRLLSRASVSGIRERLEKLDPSNNKYRPLLYELLSHQDLRKHVQGLHGSGLVGLIELLDKVSTLDGGIRRY